MNQVPNPPAHNQRHLFQRWFAVSMSAVLIALLFFAIPQRTHAATQVFGFDATKNITMPKMNSGTIGGRAYAAPAGLGAQLRTQITGTDASANIYHTTVGTTLQISVDGGSFSVLTIGSASSWNSVPLFSSLSDTAHTVTLKETSSNSDIWYDSTNFITATGTAPAVSANPLANKNYDLTATAGGNTNKAAMWLHTATWNTASTNFLIGTGAGPSLGLRLKFKATVSTIGLMIFNDGNLINLYDNGVLVGSTTLPNTSKYDYVQLATGLDSGAEHTYTIDFQAGPILTSLVTGGGTGMNLTAGITPADTLFAAYGDSITATGGNEFDGWVYRAASALAGSNTYIENLGYGGTTVRYSFDSSMTKTNAGELAARVAQVTAYSPRKIFNLYGSNDASFVGDPNFNQSAAEFLASYENMITQQAAGTPSAIIYNLQLLPRQAIDTATFSAQIPVAVAAASSSLVRYIPTTNWITLADTTDGIHPSTAGNIKIANRIIPLAATTGYTIAGPSSGTSGQASTNFTVTIASGSTFTGDETITLSDGSNGGTFTPSVGSATTTSIVTVTPTASATAFTFTYTPASSGVKTLSFTNGQRWTDASSTTYTVGSLAVIPTVTTSAASSIATSTAIFNGSITADGNASSTVRGFAYGLTTGYGATTTQSGTFGIGSFSTTTTDLTLSTLYHYRSYATNSAGTGYGGDQTFTTSALPAPVISSIASSTTQTTATITWTTDQAASSTVSYGATSSYGTASTSAALVTSHSIALSGLTAATTYHFQVGGANSVGTISTSTDQTFTTAALVISPPTVTAQSATSLSTSTATLNGTITSNNNASSTTEGFNFGLTVSYGSVASTTGTFGTGTFSQAISGLSPSTTYHYQAFAINGGGTGTSSDATFITSALSAPVISGIASSTTQTTATITWTTDQAASSTVSYGATSAYGTASTSVSLVTSHSISLSGLTAATTYHFQVGGANSAGTVSTSTDQTLKTQAVPDTTPPSVVVTAPAAGTIHGTLTFTATSSDNVAVTGVQFKIDGVNTGASGTSSPYSISWNSTGVVDGSHTIQAVANDAAGNYATSSVSVTVDNTAPSRSVASPSGTLALNTASTTISLTTNENATCHYSTSSAQSFGSMTVFTTTGGTSHSQLITGLSNGGSYIYYVKCQDSVSNTNASDFTISFTVAADTTSPTASITAPLNNSTVSGSSVSVTATATDDVSVANVQYLLDGSNLQAPLTFSPYAITWDSTSVSDGAHTLIAVAEDGSGNFGTSSTVTIKVDNTPPVEGTSSPSGVLPNGTTSTLLSLQTNENATCHYSASPGTSYGSMTAFATTGVKAHSQTISGLSDGTSYNYYVKCQDTHSNTNVSDYVISFSVGVDATPPVISAVALNHDQTTATITWMTDEPSTSQVTYGRTTSYGSASTLNSTLVTSHSVTIGGLSSNTLYHYAVLSADTLGNATSSSDYTFTTDSAIVTSSGSSRGGGHISVPTALSTPTAVTDSASGCAPGYLFNIQTGQPCSQTVIPQPPATNITPTSLLSCPARSLTIGSVGEGVRNLQRALNANGFMVALSGAGSLAHETNLFGPLTRNAVSRYQKAKGIQPTAGFFGPLTLKSFVSAGICAVR